MKLFTDNIKPILAIAIVLLGFTYFFVTTLSGIEPNDQILIAIVGTMTTAIGYYFGYSSGSAKKDEIIQDQQNKK